jgi:hypothetical protein
MPFIAQQLPKKAGERFGTRSALHVFQLAERARMCGADLAKNSSNG